MTTKPLKGCGIYALVCPDTGEIRYVGQSRDMRRRYTQHCTPSDRKSETDLALWLASLFAEDKKPICIVLEYTDKEPAALDAAEKGWVQALTSSHHLLNMTEGGAGARKGEGTGETPAASVPTNDKVQNAVEAAMEAHEQVMQNRALREEVEASKEAPKGEPERNPRGRPEAYTDEMADEVIARMHAGEALRFIVKDEHMPARSTIYEWIKRNTGNFSDRYADAVRVRADTIFDETLEIADDATNDYMTSVDDINGAAYKINGENIQRSRLRVDTRKWYLSKLVPKMYGEKITQELTGKDGGAIETKEVGKQDLARKLAFLLRQGVDAMDKGDE